MSAGRGDPIVKYGASEMHWLLIARQAAIDLEFQAVDSRFARVESRLDRVHDQVARLAGAVEALIGMKRE